MMVILLGDMCPTARCGRSACLCMSTTDYATDRTPAAQSSDIWHLSSFACSQVYMPPFKAAVDAGAAGVMAGYNRYNGSWVCGGDGVGGQLVTHTLRQVLGFRGFVVTDWWATHSVQVTLITLIALMIGRRRIRCRGLLPQSPFPWRRNHNRLIPRILCRDRISRCRRPITGWTRSSRALRAEGPRASLPLTPYDGPQVGIR